MAEARAGATIEPGPRRTTRPAPSRQPEWPSAGARTQAASLRGGPPSVDDEARPGDERGIIGRQVESGRRNLLGLAQTAHRLARGQGCACRDRVLSLAEQPSDPRRVDGARTQAIDPNATPDKIDGDLL